MAKTKSLKKYPIPDFFQADRVDSLWSPNHADLQAKAQEFRSRHEEITPSSRTDELEICLLLIDPQATFCLSDGQLPVTGALEDCIRLARWGYKHIKHIKTKVVTLDTHVRTQIFHPAMLLDPCLNHPAPFTEIKPLDVSEDVEKSHWHVDPEFVHQVQTGAYQDFGYDLSHIDDQWLQEYLYHYVNKLGSFYIWNYHAMLGDPHHCVVPLIQEMLSYSDSLRQSQTRYVMKGLHPLTEHFGVLRPEVQVSHDLQMRFDTNYRLVINTMKHNDIVVVAGQAKDFCVKSSLLNFWEVLKNMDRKMAQRFYILEDCMSCVFPPEGEDNTLAELVKEEVGMNLVNTTTPVEEWPGISKYYK